MVMWLIMNQYSKAYSFTYQLYQNESTLALCSLGSFLNYFGSLKLINLIVTKAVY